MKNIKSNSNNITWQLYIKQNGKKFDEVGELSTDPNHFSEKYDSKSNWIVYGFTKTDRQNTLRYLKKLWIQQFPKENISDKIKEIKNNFTDEIIEKAWNFGSEIDISFLKNMVIAIDEMHLFINLVKIQGEQAGEIALGRDWNPIKYNLIKKLFRYSMNTHEFNDQVRIIGSTGTPVGQNLNTPLEIINMLNTKEEDLMTIEELEEKELNITDKDEDKKQSLKNWEIKFNLKPRQWISGKVSYVDLSQDTDHFIHFYEKDVFVIPHLYQKLFLNSKIEELEKKENINVNTYIQQLIKLENCCIFRNKNSIEYNMPPQFKIGTPKMDLNFVLKHIKNQKNFQYIENEINMLFPKVIELLETIKKLDEYDLKTYGKLFKYAIISDGPADFHSNLIAIIMKAVGYNQLVVKRQNVSMKTINNYVNSIGISNYDDTLFQSVLIDPIYQTFPLIDDKSIQPIQINYIEYKKQYDEIISHMLNSKIINLQNLKKDINEKQLKGNYQFEKKGIENLIDNEIENLKLDLEKINIQNNFYNSFLLLSESNLDYTAENKTELTGKETKNNVFLKLKFPSDEFLLSKELNKNPKPSFTKSIEIKNPYENGRSLIWIDSEIKYFKI